VVERRDPSVDRFQGADSGIHYLAAVGEGAGGTRGRAVVPGLDAGEPGCPGCLVVVGERLIGGRRRVQRSVARVILGGLREMCVPSSGGRLASARKWFARDHCARRRVERSADRIGHRPRFERERGASSPRGERPRCGRSRVGGALALWPERLTQAWTPPTGRACPRDARRGLPGFDYEDGPYVLAALRQPPGLPRLYLIDRSGSRRVRVGVDPERDRKAPIR
jgi:hypothetical protein